MTRHNKLIRALYHALLADLIRRFGAQAAFAQHVKVSREHWLRQRQLRRQAIYLVLCALDVPQAEVAEALDLSRERVGQVVRAVEEERDDPVIDRALSEISAVIEGFPFEVAA